MIIRLYAGEDGQAHFEDLNVPAGETETVALKPGGDMTFRSSPDGSFSDWHTGPRRQYVILHSSQIEIGIGEGTKQVLNPSDILRSGRPERTGPHHRPGGQPGLG